MNALLINGYETYEGVGQGKLTPSLIHIADEILQSKGFDVQVTQVEKGYDIAQEVSKILWADIVFIQFPIYWFGAPAKLKEYIDKVCTAGYATGKMATGDGRTRLDSSKEYGSGGLLINKRYMLSTTWNAPKEVFDNNNSFLEGMSLDQTLFSMHKTLQFLGMKSLPSFGIFDVFKNPLEIDNDIETFKRHIEGNF